VRRFTDAAGLVTQKVFTPNRVTTATSPDGVVTTVVEGSDPRFGLQASIPAQMSVRMPSNLQFNATSSRRVTLADPADPLSLVTQVDSLVINGRAFTSVFDVAARTLTARSSVGRQAVSLLDTLGRVTEVRAPGEAAVHYNYGSRGFLTSMTQASRVFSYDYDSAGRVKKVTDPLGRFEQYAYDSAGRVVKQTLFNGREILFSYDANGNLSSVTPPGRPTHTFTANAADLDSVYTPPAAGLPVSATRYTYNLDRQLTRVSRPDSLAIDIAYDTAGRPSTVTIPTGQVVYGYSPTTGHLTSLTAPGSLTLGYAYDGPLPKTVTWGGAVQGSVGYTFDNNFRLTALTVNGANSISLGYDNDNLLSSAGALTLARDLATGRLTGTTLSGITTSLAYNDSVRTLRRYTAMSGSDTLLNAAYTRDSLNRITQLVETVQGVAKTYAYVYDSLGRLDQVRVDGVLASDYDYDANGNRTGLTTQSGSISGTYDDQDRMLTYATASYSYSANGELKTKVVGTDTTRYTYDVLGNLIQLRLADGTVVDYLVDAQRRRIGKKINAVLVQGFLYQGQLRPIAELDGNNQVVARFVYGSSVNAPEYMVKGGVTYRFITDQLGSVRLVVNTATGQVAQRIDYNEFGSMTANTNPGFQPFGYAGGILDETTQLLRFGARDYSADVGRWTAKDPIGFAGGVGSFYQYSGNDPINFSDPTGLVCVDANGQAIDCPQPPQGPPVPPPNDIYGKPNSWVNNGPSKPGRRDKWVPKERVPSAKGGQPEASWDPKGHWDVDDGTGAPREHYLPDGTKIDDKGNVVCPPQAQKNSLDRIMDFINQPVPDWVPDWITNFPKFDPWKWFPPTTGGPGRLPIP
jgi:RHS repeat-associated protein